MRRQLPSFLRTLVRLKYYILPVSIISTLIYTRFYAMSSATEDIIVTTEPVSKPIDATALPSLPRLYLDIKPDQLPIIYSSSYDISFFGLEKLHPFDTQKWGNIYKFLIESGLLANKSQSVQPLQINEAELLTHHSRDYINSLSTSVNVAAIAEIPPIAALPNFLVQKILLVPIRYQVISYARNREVVGISHFNILVRIYICVVDRRYYLRG